MKHDKARQIKWDIVDHLLETFATPENFTYCDYYDPERTYAREQIERIARVLGVTNHIHLGQEKQPNL